MEDIEQKPDFFKKILVHWLGLLCSLVAVCFCFYSHDSAQVKITLFYIGSCGAFILWLSSLIYRGESIFTKKNLYIFLPLIVYALYVVFSYFFHPYRLARMDSFCREIFSFLLFLVVCFEFKEEDFKLFLKYFFITAWIIFIYGLLQVFNLDFAIWKNFFGKRVFSTLANPNLLGSFSVFAAVIILFSYLIKPRKSLIVLFILSLINLIFSQSKGAFLSFAGSVFLGTVMYIYFFTDKYKNIRNKIIIASLFICIIAALGIGHFSVKRIDSLNFRLSTWRSTFDMIQAKPVVGTGIGSFEFIYPAYKRPEIFYIENFHNMESQHAENYYLEQWAVLGSLGFGVFLWVLFYITKQVLYKLNILVYEDRKKALLLAGFFLASISVYLHNLVDVNIYFVSTSTFLIIFNGFIFYLAFGPFDKIKKPVSKPLKISNFFVIFTAFFIVGIWFYLSKIFWTDFLIEGNISFSQIIYSIFFLLISVAILYIFISVIIKAKKILICSLSVLASILFAVFYFQFIGNVCFSRATSLAEKQNFESLGFYTKTLHYNPMFYMARHFRAVMLASRFSLVEKRDPQRGDGDEVSNDFKSALEDYNIVEKFSPNYALLHYNRGSLYLKYAASQEPEKRDFYYSKAEQDFKRALLLDPVYDNIYYQLANVELSKGNNLKAREWIEKYLNGPKEVKNTAYLQTHKDNQKAQDVFKQLGGNL